MADDERRAEIEAVAEALYGMVDALSLTHARLAIAALDRVRDARGDDGAGRLRMQRDVARRNFRMLDERTAQLEDAVKTAVQELPLTLVDSKPSDYEDGPSRAGARLRLALRAAHSARSPHG